VAFVSRAAITESFACPLWASVQQSAHPNSDSDSSGGKPFTRRKVVVPKRLRTRVRILLGPPLARRCDLSIQGPVGYGGLGFLQVFRASSAGAQKLNTWKVLLHSVWLRVKRKTVCKWRYGRSVRCCLL